MNISYRLLIIALVCAAHNAMGSETFRLDQLRPRNSDERSRYLFGASIGALGSAWFVESASRQVRRRIFGLGGVGVATAVVYYNRDRIRRYIQPASSENN